MNLLWDVGFHLGWVIAACWLAALGAPRVRGWMLARRDSADPGFPSPSHGADIARARAQSGQWVPAHLHAKFAAPGSLDRVMGVAAARDPFAQWDGKRFVPAAGGAMAYNDSVANDPAPMANWQRHRAWILAGFRPASGAAMVHDEAAEDTGTIASYASGNLLNRAYWHPDVANKPRYPLGSFDWPGPKIALALAALLTLSACGSTTPAQQQSLAAAGVTLAAIAAQNNTTVASIVTKGALFCELGGGAGIVAVVNAAGAPVTVKDQSAQAVAAACMAFQAVPVAPPVDPGAVPSMAAPEALPAVKA